jgi:predicted metal-dependent HD superfamily phosphohydrolase
MKRKGKNKISSLLTSSILCYMSHSMKRHPNAVRLDGAFSRQPDIQSGSNHILRIYLKSSRIFDLLLE